MTSRFPRVRIETVGILAVHEPPSGTVRHVRAHIKPGLIVDGGIVAPALLGDPDMQVSGHNGFGGNACCPRLYGHLLCGRSHVRHYIDGSAGPTGGDGDGPLGPLFMDVGQGRARVGPYEPVHPAGLCIGRMVHVEFGDPVRHHIPCRDL